MQLQKIEAWYWCSDCERKDKPCYNCYLKYEEYVEAMAKLWGSATPKK